MISPWRHGIRNRWAGRRHIVRPPSRERWPPTAVAVALSSPGPWPGRSSGRNPARDRCGTCRPASPRCGRCRQHFAPAYGRSGQGRCPPPAARRIWARSCPDAWGSSDDVGSSRMTRRTRSSVSVKARATSTIWRRPMERSLHQIGVSTCRARGKSGPSISRIMAAAFRRQPNPRSAGWRCAGILRHGEVRAERKFLEHAANAGLMARSRGPKTCCAASSIRQTDASRHRPSALRRQDVHQGDFPGAVVADEPDPFPAARRRSHTVRGPGQRRSAFRLRSRRPDRICHGRAPPALPPSPSYWP